MNECDSRILLTLCLSPGSPSSSMVLSIKSSVCSAVMSREVEMRKWSRRFEFRLCEFFEFLAPLIGLTVCSTSYVLFFQYLFCLPIVTCSVS